MVTIGRKPFSRVAIPNNRGMAARANKQLESAALSKAEHYSTSLGVDAPNFYFWHKENGSIPCSCSAARRGPNRDVDIGGETKKSAVYTAQDVSDFKVKNFDYGNATIKDTYGSPKSGRSPTLKEKLTVDVNNEEGSFDDFDAMSDIEDLSSDKITDFNDPLNLLSSKMIDCPICMDSGFIDSWNVHAGKRVVLDTSNVYNFDSIGININTDNNPTLLISENKKATAFWIYKLPFVWDKILRLRVYNGIYPIQPHKYTWLWKTSDNLANGEVNVKELNTLNGSGSNLMLSLAFNEVDVEFTHAEIIFAFRDAYKAQIPEVPQGYAEEFLDSSIELSVELPPDLEIVEGDYLTESKYRKIWKVSSINRRVTNGGTVFGISADLRALHSFEKSYTQLSLFKTDYLTDNLLK